MCCPIWGRERTMKEEQLHIQIGKTLRDTRCGNPDGGKRGVFGVRSSVPGSIYPLRLGRHLQRGLGTERQRREGWRKNPCGV